MNLLLRYSASATLTVRVKSMQCTEILLKDAQHSVQKVISKARQFYTRENNFCNDINKRAIKV